MNRSAKYLSLIMATLCGLPCFSQKVIVLKNTGFISKGNTLFVSQMVFDSVWACSPNRHDEYIIPTDKDSLELSAINSGSFEINFENNSNYQPPSYLIRHIRSFRGDTIVISGLAFSDYLYKRTTGATFDGIEKGDSVSRKKNLPLSEEDKMPFPASIPYPEIYVAGINAGEHLKLQSYTGTSTSMSYINGNTTNYSFAEIHFSFVLDLKGLGR